MKLKNLFSLLAIVMVVLMAGCKKDADMSAADPLVISTDPINVATNVAINSKISATFSVIMDASTINANNFTLQQGTTPVLGTVAYTGTTGTFTPTAKLVANKVYTATITTNARDRKGRKLATNYVWSFTTGNTSDMIQPTVLATNPLNNAKLVPFNNSVLVTFSKSMDPATLTPLTFNLTQGTTVVLGAITSSEATATFKPLVNLKPNTTYTGTITTGVKDMSGNAMAAIYTFTFTTGTVAAAVLPEVTLTDPAKTATDVPLNKAIAVTFSETMNPLTINLSTFTLKQGTTTVQGTFSHAGKKYTFTPAVNLEAGKVYTGTITTGVKDLAGNALKEDYTFTFTTVPAIVVILPTVLSTDPQNNAIGVALNKAVKINFSVAMDPLSITTSTFTLKQGTNAVAGQVTYNGTTATFTPTANLAGGTLYSAEITTGAKNLAGSALAANTVINFTTYLAPVGAIGPAPVNLGAAGNYVILAKSKISNVPTSAITGDLGLSPAAESYITGFSQTDATGYATSPQVTGKIFAADMVSPTSSNLTTAVENMITAYNDAAGRPTPDVLNLGSGNIGSQTIIGGLYKFSSSVTVPTNVTLSGGANDVWIFQISGDFTMSGNVRINLVGGAQAKNVFFQVAGEAIIGPNAHFEGIMMSMTAITLKTGASYLGRALAQTAVILDGNAVTKP